MIDLNSENIGVLILYTMCTYITNITSLKPFILKDFRKLLTKYEKQPSNMSWFYISIKRTFIFHPSKKLNRFAEATVCFYSELYSSCSLNPSPRYQVTRFGFPPKAFPHISCYIAYGFPTC